MSLRTVYANAGRIPRFGPLDWRASAVFLIILYNPFSKITWITAFLLLVGLIFMERKGYTMPNLLRRIEVQIFGKYRPRLLGRRKRELP